MRREARGFVQGVHYGELSCTPPRSNPIAFSLVGRLRATRVQEPTDVTPAFRAALDRFDSSRPALTLGHFDADGLSAVAILKRALDRAARSSEVRITGKGENPWSPALRSELKERRPGGLLVTDLGAREGDILPGTPTVLIDHHVPTGGPGDATLISGKRASGTSPPTTRRRGSSAPRPSS
jgi:single-stranded DNA-specific DHH superfamily exonuclease